MNRIRREETVDDELKRKLAASLDGPTDGPADPAVVAELDRNPQAREFVKGLYAMDKALRNWPKTKAVTSRDADAWEQFALAIEAKLGEAPWEKSDNGSGFDPLKPIVFGDDEVTASPRERERDHNRERSSSKQQESKTEKKSMAQSQDDNNDDDLEGLAALTRTSAVAGSVSIPPPPVRPGPALVDDKMDESSGVVDIKQLAELALKQPPAPSLESLRGDSAPEAKSSASDSAKAKTEAKTKSSTATAASSKSAANDDAKAAPARSIAEAREAKEKKPNTFAIVAFTAIAAAAVSGIAVSQFNRGSGANQQSSAPTVATTTSFESSNTNRQEVRRATESIDRTTEGVEMRQAAAPTPAQDMAATTVTAPPQAPQGDNDNTVGGADLPVGAPSGAQGAMQQTMVAAIPAPTVVAPPSTVAPVNANPPAPGATTPHDERQQSPSPDPVVVATASDTHNNEAENSPSPSAERLRRNATVVTPSREVQTQPRPVVAVNSQPTQPTTTRPTQSEQHTTTARATPTPSPTPAPTTTPAPTGPANPLTQRMRDAVGGSAPTLGNLVPTQNPTAHTTTPTTPSGNLPERPTSAQVSAAMSPLAGQVRACTQGQLGTATVALQIANTGNIVNASVSGFSPAINSCIQNVVRRAHFSPFTRPTVSIVYPFRILPPQ